MLENMRISIQGIWSHKMRSFLTMLESLSVSHQLLQCSTASEQIKEGSGAGNKHSCCQSEL